MSSTILACWWPQWHPHRPYSGQLLSLHVYAPPTCPTWAPSLRFSMQWKRSAIPVNCCWAQHAPVAWPCSLSGAFSGPFSSFSPHERARPKAAAVSDEDVGLPDEPLGLICSRPSLRSSPYRPWLSSLCPCSGYNLPSFPHVIAHVGSWNEVTTSHRVACWLGTHSLQLLTVCWHPWILLFSFWWLFKRQFLVISFISC